MTTDEQRVLDEVAGRIQAAYPNRSPDEVRHTFDTVVRDFDTARVRDFVPLLVERRVRASLEF
ncbi:DUF3562 domain-containing protein [Gordonia sp. LSe1-13]|uniref:DUF3562 domain-containing protein n=1 Tax=Gordonia sesuvii TaxID=3116777 RepID=A0ABU7MCK1_9ACTN|nr:DUF3562 domain-containing protein [Gordonia sp. LSe1-13]